MEKTSGDDDLHFSSCQIKKIALTLTARLTALHSCFVLTRGDDYKNHVKCISEDQKYGGKNYEAKANKGDVKQQQWVQVKCSKLLHLNSLPLSVFRTYFI